MLLLECLQEFDQRSCCFAFLQLVIQIGDIFSCRIYDMTEKLYICRVMKLLGNVIWLVLGGLLTSVMYLCGGLLMCVTVIGIPFGVQLIKFAGLAFWPFGKNVTMDPASGCLTTFFNILWVALGWWEIAVVHLIFGLLLCITVIGIPFGKQHFKLARLSLVPFGCKFN